MTSTYLQLLILVIVVIAIYLLFLNTHNKSVKHEKFEEEKRPGLLGNVSSGTPIYPILVDDSTTGNKNAKVDTQLIYDPDNNKLTANKFNGPVTSLKGGSKNQIAYYTNNTTTEFIPNATSTNQLLTYNYGSSDPVKYSWKLPSELGINFTEFKGSPGLPGSAGSKGLTGLTGSPGPSGIRGIPGPAGLTGPQGDKGDTGISQPIARGTYGTVYTNNSWNANPNIRNLSVNTLYPTTKGNPVSNLNTHVLTGGNNAEWKPMTTILKDLAVQLTGFSGSEMYINSSGLLSATGPKTTIYPRYTFYKTYNGQEQTVTNAELFNFVANDGKTYSLKWANQYPFYYTEAGIYDITPFLVPTNPKETIDLYGPSGAKILFEIQKANVIINLGGEDPYEGGSYVPRFNTMPEGYESYIRVYPYVFAPGEYNSSNLTFESNNNNVIIEYVQGVYTVYAKMEVEIYFPGIAVYQGPGNTYYQASVRAVRGLFGATIPPGIANNIYPTTSVISPAIYSGWNFGWAGETNVYRITSFTGTMEIAKFSITVDLTQSVNSSGVTYSTIELNTPPVLPSGVSFRATIVDLGPNYPRTQWASAANITIVGDHPNFYDIKPTGVITILPPIR